MKNIKYLHFGERCHTLVIINMLLNINIKTLFQLGIFPFNAIVNILEDEKFNDIINVDYLLYDGNKVDYLKEDKLKNYCHGNNLLVHTKYHGLRLLHDYGVENNVIINHNFIQEQHLVKRNNFYEYINSGDFLCFITILYESNLSCLEYEKMYNVLTTKYGLKDFVIVIFTNDSEGIPNNIPKCFEIIILDDEYRDDIICSDEYRIKLYKTMWEKFVNVMNKYGYEHKCFEDQFDINRMPRL